MCIFVLHGTFSSYSGQVLTQILAYENEFDLNEHETAGNWTFLSEMVSQAYEDSGWFWPEAKGNSKYVIVIVLKLIFNFKNELVWIKVARRKTGIQAESFGVSMTLVDVHDEENLILAIIKSEILSFLLLVLFSKKN